MSDIQSIFENVKSELLTDEVKQKLETLVEVKVNAKSKAHIAKLDQKWEEFKTKEVAKLEAKAVKYVDEYLVEKLDGYLNLVADSYIKENKLAVENGIKAELFESIVGGMKGVLKEHNISTVGLKKAEVDASQTKKVKAQLDKYMQKTISLKRKLKGERARAIFERNAAGLTAMQREKLVEITGEFDVDDLKIFESKVATARELVENTSKKPTEKKKSLNESVSRSDKDLEIEGQVKVTVADEDTSSPKFSESLINSEWL